MAHTSPSPPQYVSSIGACRRLHALMANGHSETGLRSRIDGASNNTGFSFLHHRKTSTTVRRSTHEKIVALYHELHDTPGDCDVNRDGARKRGWATPAQWDGIDMDDPDAEPAAPAAATRLRVVHPDPPTIAGYTPLCRRYDPALWLSDVTQDKQTAAMVCDECPLQRPCLRYALVHEETVGVWGGIPPYDRAKLLRKLRKQVHPYKLDGTDALDTALDTVVSS